MFPSLNEGKNCIILVGIKTKMLKNPQWEFKCNLLSLLDLYIDIGTRYIPNMKLFSIALEAEQNKAENKCSSLQQRYVLPRLFKFDYKGLFVCIKDKKCPRIAIPAYQHFRCVKTIFQGRGVFLEFWQFDKHSPTTQKRKAPQAEKLRVSLPVNS